MILRLAASATWWVTSRGFVRTDDLLGCCDVLRRHPIRADGKAGEMALATSAVPEHIELRRAVSIWGSYSWGYADVGADIYVALGLVVGAAMGAANVAFAFAGDQTERSLRVHRRGGVKER